MITKTQQKRLKQTTARRGQLVGWRGVLLTCFVLCALVSRITPLRSQTTTTTTTNTSPRQNASINAKSARDSAFSRDNQSLEQVGDDSAPGIKLVIQITKHSSLLPKQYYNESQPWTREQPPGHLTRVGRRQAYYLGLSTAQRYQPLLSGGLLEREVYVKAFQTPSALQSASSHMIGLNPLTFQHSQKLDIPPTNKKLMPQGSMNIKFNPLLTPFSTALPHGFDPDPVMNNMKKTDPLFFIESHCKKYVKIRDSELSRANTLLKSSQNFVNFLTKVRDGLGLGEGVWSGGKATLLDQCVYLAGFALNDYFSASEPILDFGAKGSGKGMVERLKRCLALKEMAGWRDRRLAKVKSSLFWEILLGVLDRKISSLKVPSLAYPFKYALFAGDHGLISSILALKNLTSFHCNLAILTKDSGGSSSGSASEDAGCLNHPDLSSNFAFEVIQKSNNFYIKTSFNGEYLDLCGHSSQPVDPNSPGCDYKTFKKQITENFIFDDFREFCGFKEKLFGLGEDYTWAEDALIVFIVIINLVLVFLCFFYVYMRKRMKFFERIVRLPPG